MRRTFIILPIFLAGFAGTSFASTALFTLSPYNAFVFGNFSDTSDYGGGVAAGGSITMSGTSVAGALLGESLTDFTGQYTLVAGGTMNATNGTLAAGNAFGSGPSNNFNLTLQNGDHFSASPTADPIDFSAQKTSFQNLSTNFSHLTANANCVYDGFSTTTCTANAAGLNVINVSDPTILGQNRTVNITLGASSYLVINVAGGTTATPDYMTNFGMKINGNGVNGDATTTAAHNLLFNYYQATGNGLNLTSVMGSVLAPNANVTGVSSGQIDGTLVANAFNGPTEFHNFGYEGSVPSGAAPEPMSMVLIGSGLIGLGILGRRKKRQA